MANPYETDKLLSEYLLLHYGDPARVLPWGFGPREALGFPSRCANELLEHPIDGRALELGCAVGRACFELSKHCHEVIGIDYSARFIEAAAKLAEVGEVYFSVPDEGELSSPHSYRLQKDFHPDRVRFEVGDAGNLRTDLGSFQVVVAANLLCRLPQPRDLLDRFADLVSPGGQLLLTSPYTWMAEFTPKENWLGGFQREGQPVRTLDTLKEVLDGPFRLASVDEVPFMIREHSRKFQWTVAQASRWVRV